MSVISNTMQNFIQISLVVSVLRMRDFAPLSTNDSAIFFWGGVLEKGYSRDARTDFDAKNTSNDAVPRSEMAFGGRKTSM